MFDFNLAAARLSDPNIRVVSFDVFDTLLRRRIVHPHHIFWFTEAILLKDPDIKDRARNFGEVRELAGRLSNRHSNLHGREDATIHDIYKFVGAMLPDLSPYLERAKSVEFELERSLLEAYPLGTRLFEVALRAGKRIVLTSDQYLPKQYILDRLHDAGFAGFDHLFLSGNLGALKVTGTLFDWLPLRLDTPRSQIIHVGDNEHVDYTSARRRGLQAMLVPKSIEFAHHEGVGSAICRHGTLSSFAAATYFNERSDAVLSGSYPPSPDHIDFVGYTLLGPLLVGLSRWIADRLEAGEIDRIWFLSRDGEILSKAFSILHPELIERADYIYASRRLLVYSTASWSGDEVFRHYRKYDRPDILVHEFIDAIESKTQKFASIRSQFAPGDKLGDKGVRQRFENLLNALAFAGPSETEELSRIQEYYKAHINGAKRLGVFDVGWKGNLQRGLAKLLSAESINIIGHYIGLMYEDVVPKQLVDASSYAFNLNFPKNVFSDLNQCIWIIETLFAGTHPSVVGIEKNEDGWQPIFENEDEAKILLRLRAERMHGAAMRFVHKAASTEKSIVTRLTDRRQIVEAMAEFIARPAHFDGASYANLAWMPNIDETNMQIVATAPVRTRKQLKLARRRSAWRAGFAAFHGTAPDRAWRPWRRKKH